MKKFNILKGIPANLPMMNVDTDMIIPKQFLKTIKRTGLGKGLFFEMRYDENSKKIEKFVLNKKPYNNSPILLVGKNFGCGSSREHAPWALLDFGIRCVIGASFADIFYNNCFKNGMLPIILGEKQIEELRKDRDRIKLEIARVADPDERSDKTSTGFSDRAYKQIWRMCQAYEDYCIETNQTGPLPLNIIRQDQDYKPH